jgi:hypothetical protein
MMRSRSTISVSIASLSWASGDRTLPSAAQIGCVVVEIAEDAGVRQPQVGDIGGNLVEVAKPRNAQQTEKEDQQEEEDEDR